MKLFYCRRCEDVVKCTTYLRDCECGRSAGMYKRDGLHAVYSGEAVPLGFANGSLMRAIRNQPNSGDGERFTAFVIPEICDTFERVPHD